MCNLQRLTCISGVYDVQLATAYLVMWCVQCNMHIGLPYYKSGDCSLRIEQTNDRFCPLQAAQRREVMKIYGNRNAPSIQGRQMS